jgi:nitrile hydratase
MLLSTGASARSTDAVAARFRAGDAVVARNINPVGHTRLPRYIKGKRGVIRADHGVFTFPDTTAHGQGHKPQHLYSVRFMAQELWGDEASPRDSVFIDLFDDYMDADPAAASGAAGDEPAGAQVRPLGSRTSRRRAARPERSGGARKKPRKARRPGVRVQKATAKSQAAAPARASRKAATAKKKKSIRKRAPAAKAPRARVSKPARVKKKARAARS